MSKQLSAQWEQWSQKTESLSVRERAILLVTLLAAVAIVWLQFVFLPWEQEQDKVVEEIKLLKQEQNAAATNIQVLNIKLGKNPNDELRQQARELNVLLDELGGDIEGRLAQLLAPQQMVPVMQSVLSDYQGMKLIAAKNLPAEPLDLSADQVSLVAGNNGDQASDQAAENEAVVYSHVFEITLEGSYFQTLSFLKRLEEMEGFFWRSIEYSVKDYPSAEIKIQITTLSLQEEWIGV